MSSYTNFFLLFIFFISHCSLIASTIVSYDDRAILINGERKLILSGAIHYPRSTPEMWPSLFAKAKEGGLNAIETYTFWNAHEPSYRQYDFKGNLDLVRFIKEIQAAGMYAILRIGPYVCAEWNLGGFPGWLATMPNITFRTDNEVFKNEMEIYTTKIVKMMEAEELFASQGGPIILAQIENEYGNIMSGFGEAGKTYIQWSADLAFSYQIGIPWFMSQQPDPPKGMINACNGFYCDQFTPSPGFPKMWTENWIGWFKNWGGQFPRRAAEDSAYSVARFFQLGGTLHNYYMYHGGTNFGRSAGGPYISTTYDYDAALDEYGNKNQPKWGHFKKLHDLLMSMEKTLTYGAVKNISFESMVEGTVYDFMGTRACFLANTNNNTDVTVDFEGRSYDIPAWSVSILPDCKTVAYQTSHVNEQATVMIKIPDETNIASKKAGTHWQWRWKPEQIDDLQFKEWTSERRSDFMYTTGLQDQTIMTNDTSDYLWFMTSVKIDHKNPDWRNDVYLKVHTEGHILHVFVNGDHIGTKYAKSGSFAFDFESNKFKTKHGWNTISMLSATVGRQNYGAFFEKTKVGVSGQVSLHSENGNIMSLETNHWAHKVGLNGLSDLEDGLFMENKKRFRGRWHKQELPTNRMFTWYKTTFKAPAGKDPVAFDFLGLGKGIAWVNGKNIGRYWPSYYANYTGCSPTCDYRGNYGSDKCQTGCGLSSQRWYHVPRSYLKDDRNELVLFEEFGGDPTKVKIHTVAAKSI